MQYQQIVSLGLKTWGKGITGVPFLILGPPGIGKSSTAEDIAAEMTRYVRENDGFNDTDCEQWKRQPEAIHEVLDLSTMLPEDLLGLPWRDGEVTKYCPQEWLSPLCVPGAYGVLCLDDLPASDKSVQVAARQLILTRRIGKHQLSDGILIIVTGNRREDKSASSTLPAHLRNCVVQLSLEPNLAKWCEWYGARDLAPVIASFLRYRPSHLSKLPKDADAKGAFATPRTWEKLGSVLNIAADLGLTLDVASGLVGEGPATELMAFINIKSQLVDPEAVLNDPQGAMQDPGTSLNSPDRAYAMTTGLGEVSAAWVTDKDRKGRKTVPAKFLRAVGWVTKGNREFIATAVYTFTSNGGNINSLLLAATQNPEDKLIQDVIDFLAETFPGNSERRA